MVDFGLLSLSFSAGVASFLNPCSFALLPAYLSYFLGRKEETSSLSMEENAIRGMKLGGLATTGFAAVFISIGSLVSLIGFQIRSFLPSFLLVIAGIILVLGMFWLFDRPILTFSKITSKVKLSKSSFFLFGVAYALSSLACVFPVFLMLIFSAIGTGGFVSGLFVFISFTLGMGVLMIFTSMAMALSKTVLLEKIQAARKYITRIAGAILILAGIYLLYYWNSLTAI